MKITTLLTLILLFNISCSKNHNDVYIYDEQAYSSTTTSEFAFSHFKLFANTNVLIIRDTQSKYDKVREQELKNLCSAFEMNCKELDMTHFNEETISKGLEIYRSFNGEKFLLVTASNQITAKYIGSIQLIEKEGSAESLMEILKSLKIEETEQASISKQITDLKL